MRRTEKREKNEKDEEHAPFGLSGNVLKLLAMISMTVDHVGYILLGNNEVCRIIGRLAFPIFAFFIAEGATYTRNKGMYLLRIFVLGVICQVVYFFAERDWHLNILLTFSVSVALISAVSVALRKGKWFWILPILALSGTAALCYGLPILIPKARFEFDYGFFGILFPVFVYCARGKIPKLIAAAVGIFFICLDYMWLQWFSFLALVPLAIYNGTRGKLKTKYVFYVFYPLHIAVIYGIAMLINGI